MNSEKEQAKESHRKFIEELKSGEYKIDRRRAYCKRMQPNGEIKRLTQDEMIEDSIAFYNEKYK